MRQTPFGVWNTYSRRSSPSGCRRCNEADAFRRLEHERTVGGADRVHAAMRQTPFGVWNEREAEAEAALAAALQ